MARDSAIAWTHHTFNIAWGCTKISPGCKNCYADRDARRYGFKVFGQVPRRTFGEKHWGMPLRWNRDAATRGVRERVFCSSMSDIGEDHPTIAAERGKLWPVIQATPSLNWLLLTKRAERLGELLPADWGSGYPNVWLGVSIENDSYTWRADYLRLLPAAVRFISYEPALGPVPSLSLAGINWVICGGESGPGYRVMSQDWARYVRDRCRSEGVPFFFKQHSGRFPETDILLDGEVIREYPYS